MFYALLSICLFGSALAQIASLGRCPEVQTHPNFYLAPYQGRWYQAERYFSVVDIATKCNLADYTLSENGTLKMVNSKTSIVTGIGLTTTGTARVPDMANAAKLKVKLDSDILGIETDYWVLGTDYRSYAVVYNCVNVQLIKYQQAWILTRDRNPSQSVIDQAVEVIKKSKLDRSKFLKSNQTDC